MPGLSVRLPQEEVLQQSTHLQCCVCSRAGESTGCTTGGSLSMASTDVAATYNVTDVATARPLFPDYLTRAGPIDLSQWLSPAPVACGTQEKSMTNQGQPSATDEWVSSFGKSSCRCLLLVVHFASYSCPSHFVVYTHYHAAKHRMPNHPRVEVASGVLR